MRFVPRIQLAALAVAVTVAAVGCGDDAGTTAGGSIRGRTFLSQSVTEGGTERPLVEDTTIRLQLHDDGRLTASAGCNTLGADATVTDDRIEVRDLSTTDMGCDPARHAQDEWLADFLAADPTYALDGDLLVLHDDSTSIELLDRRVADPDRPLEGTLWRLEGIIDGDAVSSAPGWAKVTLRFADGQVAIDLGGCGTGTATVSVEAARLAVGPLALESDGCELDELAAEEAIVATLDGAIGYDIEADGLTLTHPSGHGLTLRTDD